MKRIRKTLVRKPRSVLPTLFLLLAALFLFGCPEKEEEGPLEKVGKQLDEAADSAADALKDAAEELEE